MLLLLALLAVAPSARGARMDVRSLETMQDWRTLEAEGANILDEVREDGEYLLSGDALDAGLDVDVEEANDSFSDDAEWPRRKKTGYSKAPTSYTPSSSFHTLRLQWTRRVRCQGAWGPFSQCSASCGGGKQQKTYKIRVPASNYGCGCTARGGETRTRTCNANPCPVDCVGAWAEWSQCDAQCNGGTQQRSFKVTTSAQYGGKPCVVRHQETQTRCCNYQPCPVDCKGAWNEWGTCGASCGGGVQARTFEVSTAANGYGTKCQTGHGQVQKRDCNIDVKCPVDCVGAWGAFGECSATCGGGTRSRAFKVHVTTAHGGSACVAKADETQDDKCNTNSCPVDCEGSWGEFAQCSATCGGGKQARKFAITRTAAHGGLACEAGAGQVEARVCQEDACPIDCKGTWAEWSECSASCGPGEQSRAFKVATKSKYGGKTCVVSHSFVQTRQCNQKPCPINCVGSFGAFETCSATCGGGEQIRTFTVTTPADFGGKKCEFSDQYSQSQKCGAKPCPVDCEGLWGEYGKCSSTCGGGKQSRTFKVTRPAAHGGVACKWTDGFAQAQVCNTDPCPVNCAGAWGTWETCSKPCGGGEQSRSFKVNTGAKYAGKSCAADEGQVQKQNCNTQPCPVNCVGDWGEFGECSATCGGGQQTRSFTVTVAASFGGSKCSAKDGQTEKEACNAKPCPVDCVGHWDEYGECSSSCGGGKQTRAFKVTTPAAHGGTSCDATDGAQEPRKCAVCACPTYSSSSSSKAKSVLYSPARRKAKSTPSSGYTAPSSNKVKFKSKVLSTKGKRGKGGKYKLGH